MSEILKWRGSVEHHTGKTASTPEACSSSDTATAAPPASSACRDTTFHASSGLPALASKNWLTTCIFTAYNNIHQS